MKIGVYNDPGCKVPLRSIDWEEIHVGSLKHRKFYIKNEVEITCNATMMSTEGFIPNEAEFDLTIGFLYNRTLV